MSWRPCRGAAFFASPDKWTKVPCQDKIVQMAAKNKAPERRPAALLTLSW